MKKTLCLVLAAFVSVALWAESFSGFMNQAFGSDASLIEKQLENDGWTRDGVDFASFDGDFYTYYYSKEDGLVADSISITSSYAGGKFCMAAEFYQFPEDDMLQVISEKEKSLVNRYNLSRCTKENLAPLHTFFTMEDEEILADETETGDFENSCSRFYIGDSGNYFVVIKEDMGEGMSMVMLVYGMGPDCQNAIGAKVSEPKLKAKKKSSEVFEGIPFGSSALDSVRFLKASGWSIVSSEGGENGFFYVYAMKDGSALRDVNCTALLCVFRDDVLLMGGAMFDFEQTDDGGEALRNQIAFLEKSLVKQFKMKAAVESDVKKYSQALGTELWDAEANKTAAGDMASALRFWKSKEGSIFMIRADETGSVIFQIASEKNWKF